MPKAQSTSIKYVWAVWLLLAGLLLGYAAGYIQYANGDEADSVPLAATAAPTRVPPTAVVCPTPAAAVPAICEEIPPLETAEDYLARAVELWNRGFYATPLADVNTAIELDPALADAYFYRGWIVHEGYQDSNFRWHIDYDQALVDYTTALTLDPEYSRAYNNRGMIYATKGNMEAALPNFQRAVELDPEYYYGNFNLIAAASRLQLYADVVTYCQNYWATLSDDVRYFPQATSCIRAGNEAGEYEFVVDAVNRQIALYSEQTHSQWLFDDLITRGRAYRELGRYDDALADLEQAVEIAQEIELHQLQLVSAYLEIVDVYIAQGDLTRAFAELNRLIAEYPEASAVFVARADLHYDQGSYAQALADYNRARELPYYPREHVTERIAEIEAILAEDTSAAELD